MNDNEPSLNEAHTNQRPEIKNEEILMIKNYDEKDEESQKKTCSQTKTSHPKGSDEIIRVRKSLPQRFHNFPSVVPGGKKVYVGKIIKQLNDTLIDKLNMGKISSKEKFEKGENVIVYTDTSSGSNRIRESVKLGICQMVSQIHNKHSVVTLKNNDSSEVKKDENHEENGKTISNTSSVSSNDSRAAVVIVPVEVNSLSKFELIVIERTDDVCKKSEHKYKNVNCYK